MMQPRVLVFLLLMWWSGLCPAQIPVILRVTAADQEDTLGCNFVQELTRITYDALINGKARLWNSPGKEIQISGEGLRSIEQSSNTLFTGQEVIFIYEYWSNLNRDLKSVTTGFLFSNKTKLGEDVEYGYVEFEDLQEFFMRERVRTNANGNFNANLMTYLQSKYFNYNFLQFAGKVIDNVNDSRKIREEFIGVLKFNQSSFARNEVPQKMVRWTIESGTDRATEKSKRSYELLLAIEKYLRSNEEVFYNLGGDQVQTHVQKGNWKVSKVEVNELWKKINGEIMFDPTEVIIYINDKPLASIPYRDMLRMEVRVNDLHWLDVMRLKNFNYLIRSINQQEILRADAFAYQKALLEAAWNKLTVYAAGR